jgi:hypothetical protein
MSFLIDERDDRLKSELIESGATTADSLHSHGQDGEGASEVIRLPMLLAEQPEACDEKAWLVYAIRKYKLLHIPNLHLSLRVPKLDDLSYKVREELIDKLIFPLGETNGVLALGKVIPYEDLSDDAESEIRRLSASQNYKPFLVSFSEMTSIISRQEKHLLD